MHTFRTLGAIGLTADDGREFDGLLRQPKRLALLAYLASPEPGAWHRRDTLLGVFWPDLDAHKARTSLRSALYVVRQELGPDAVRTRGDEDVSLNPQEICSDAGQFASDLAGGRLAKALALYRGDYLPGLFIRDSAEFDRWLDDERRRLRQLATLAAARYSVERESANDTAGAIAAQRRLVELDLADETAARRLISLLDRGGERGQALAVYDRLQGYLRGEFETEPSADTTRLIRELRARPEPLGQDRPSESAGGSHESPPAPLARPSRGPWLVLSALIAMVLLVVSVRSYRSSPRIAVAAAPKTLLVLPVTNATGDSTNDYVGTGLAEDIARRLSALRIIEVRSTPRADWPARLQDSPGIAARAVGATIALRSRLLQVGDTFVAEVGFVDVSTGAERPVATERFTRATLPDAGSRIAAQIAGEAFRVPLPVAPRTALGPVDPEAYRLAMQGWYRLLSQDDPDAAQDLFLRATEADPTYARAWSGLSSIWSAAAATGRIEFDEGFARAQAAATRAIALDSLEGSAWANLGFLHTIRSRNVAAGEPYFRRAIAAEPANPEIFMVYSTALRFAWSWEAARDAIRVARQLDPLSAYYAEREANGALCEDRAEEALRLYLAQVELDPRARSGHLGVARSLARLGRWEDAIMQLRAMLDARGDSVLADSLASMHGEGGYWALKHAEGRKLLRNRQALARAGWVSPYVLGVAEIGAGNLDAGMSMLESSVRSRDPLVSKLPCNPEIDEIRSTPRYQHLLEEVERIPFGLSPRGLGQAGPAASR